MNYQLAYYEETRDLIGTFKKTLQKEAVVSDDFKNSILIFLKHTIDLINIKEEVNKNEKQYNIEKLNESVTGTQQNHFGIKFWLQDRIDEIKA